ncbi:protein-L-isoaspartate O-methyltransferase [Salinigranum rubrum]|uniref:Protein-L-isoaspartate O-methyltransferase n=1 Tax=Salinigranum rubrum TaxID=755307 RepID=A0A2I8VFG1_9EURY|nr:protein-L-isoaspartate(D-aspartate) O-methyltransferase [Salinigranum rubrum]AUV80604.1 protein-L-isoaspartate O-methyltransferase [Salinigranum rubrum]
MVRDGENHATARHRLVDRLVERGYVERESTERALRAVPRHEFVPEGSRREAYADRPLSIGRGQTISAPHMVALMTDLLDVGRDDRVLEVGTGCGYHAAVTSEVVGPGNVYSVEYDAELADDARARLERLGYEIHVRQGDGRQGWPEHAPYDRAYLTCAPRTVPEAVVDQVRAGGRVVSPEGMRRQKLVVLTPTEEGVERTTHGGVRFVSMRGGSEGS